VLFVIDRDRYRLALADAEAALAVRHDGSRAIPATLEAGPRGIHHCRESRHRPPTVGISSRATSRRLLRASVNGFITNLNLAKGTYASQGKPMTVIDSDSYRVGAYFEETKIPRIKPGASAEIYLMDGSPALQGTVSGISRGITDQDNKDGPELLSSINPTFTWVRLAQRIPVRIDITHVPPGVLISAGMTATVVIKDGAAPARCRQADGEN
jgi:multidrug resistance efflux pump